MKRIALFKHHPECSNQCCDGMNTALSSSYHIDIFLKEQASPALFSEYDVLAFPGGIGDADSYDKFFRRKVANAVADHVENGGYYLGICMGAYWAGSHYFDILNGVDAVQYIKRDTADIKRPYSTVAKINWNGYNEKMFFYDGCALIGDESKFKTIARYSNGDPMAIIQNRIGLIGCHPEAMEFWFDKPYIKDYWHQFRHHKLLLEFVNELTMQEQHNEISFNSNSSNWSFVI